MESLLALIFISAILNLVTAQSLYGYYQPILHRHSLFVDNDPRLKLGALDQFNSFWKQQNLGHSSKNIKYIPQIQRASGINYHKLENGVKHFRQRYGAQNNKIELGVGLSSNNPRLSPAFVENNADLRLSVQDQVNPTFRNGQRFGYNLKSFEYNPKLKTKQASEINNRREENGINKYEHLLHSIKQASEINNRREENDINKYKHLLHSINGDDDKIYDQKNSQRSGDVDSKYFQYQSQINMDTKNPHIMVVDPEQSLLSGKQMYNFNNIGFGKNLPSLPWNHTEENGVKHISRTSYQIRHNKQTHSSSGRIRPTYVMPPNALHKQQVQLQHSNLRQFQTPEEDTSYVRIGHNNETPKYLQNYRIEKINDEEPKENSLPIVDPNPPADVEDLNTEISKDRLRAILDLFKNQEKIKLQQHNSIQQNLIDKNEDIVTKFIIKHFTPEDMKHLISYAKTGVENAKVHMALKNYKMITHALIDFIHYSYLLTGYIQNEKIISENKQPDSDVLTSTMENVFAGDESKKLSLLPDKVERSLNNIEHLTKSSLYGDSENGNIIKNIDFHVIHNRRTLGVQKPNRYENYERTSEYQKADYNENIKGVSEVQIAGNNKNIEGVYEVHKEGNNEDIERNFADQKANYNENIEQNSADQKANYNENIEGISEVRIAGNNENIEGTSEIGRAENNENIEGVSSDYQIIVNEENVEHNHMKNDSSVNMHGDGVLASKKDSISQIERETHKKVKNNNKTELELFMQNLQIHKKIEDAFCEKLNTDQAINVMESILMNFIEDLSHRFDNEVILKTAEYSVSRNLNAERNSQDCYYY